MGEDYRYSIIDMLGSSNGYDIALMTTFNYEIDFFERAILSSLLSKEMIPDYKEKYDKSIEWHKNAEKKSLKFINDYPLNEFDAIEVDEHKQDEFVEIYRGIIDTLEEPVSESMLSSFSKDVIICRKEGFAKWEDVLRLVISLINKVSYKQLMKRKQTQKKVGDLMGGKVLDLDIIRAHDDGINEGISQGISKGAETGQNNLIKAVELLREGDYRDDSDIDIMMLFLTLIKDM